jgi:clan AA aspartic protease
MEEHMSKFMVNLTAINPVDRQRRTAPIKVMVDTGAENSWLPRKALEDAGITPKRKRRYITADKRVIERDVGYAILTAEGYDVLDEVVFAEENDLSLLGVRTIEGFNVMVDNVTQRFVAVIPTV